MDPVRFSVTSNGAPRLGTITFSNASRMDTPSFMYYTKSGSVPHVSREVFERILPDGHALFNFPLPSNLGFYEPVKKLDQGLTKFVGLEHYFSCCSITDCVVDTPIGYNKKDRIAIKTKSGNQLIDHNRYMNVMEVFNPDMYVTLCISDTNFNSTFSAVEKSVNISNRLFESCLERHRGSDALKRSGIIAPIQGGYNVSERIRSAKFLSEYNEVLGFLLDGFFTDGTIVEEIPSDLVIPVIEKTMKHLPNDKMKIIFGAWTPSVIIDLINSGIDMFDSSFIHLTTERKSALIFDYNLKYKNDMIVMDIVHNKNDENIENQKTYEICLSDICYFGSFIPLKDSCTCLTCKKYTRSYIHHLIVSNDLLGSILLTIHNLHYFDQFFKDIREMLLKNTQ